MKKTFTLLVAALMLTGCLFTPDKMRVQPENRQNSKTALVVLVPKDPHVQYLAQRVQDSIQVPATLPGFDGEKLVTDFMAKRLKGKGFELIAVTNDKARFAAAYDNDWSFPRPERIRDEAMAWGAEQGAGIVVVVYWQAHKDFVYESIHNLYGYGVVNRWQDKPAAYAAIQIEALELDIKSRIGNAESYRSDPLPPELWQESFDTATGPVAIPATAAPALKEAITKTLLDTVQNAAQEAGLSH